MTEQRMARETPPSFHLELFGASDGYLNLLAAGT
jgi:hypothetical protein